MNASPIPHLTSSRSLAIETETARLGIAMDRVFAASGPFGTVVAQTQLCLRALAARIQAEGGDLGGWSA